MWRFAATERSVPPSPSVRGSKSSLALNRQRRKNRPEVRMVSMQMSQASHACAHTGALFKVQPQGLPGGVLMEITGVLTLTLDPVVTTTITVII